MRDLISWPGMDSSLLGGLLLSGAIACTPRVEVAAPEKPITINLNVKIEHEVRVKIEDQLEKEVFKDEKLF